MSHGCEYCPFHMHCRKPQFIGGPKDGDHIKGGKVLIVKVPIKGEYNRKHLYGIRQDGNYHYEGYTQ